MATDTFSRSVYGTQLSASLPPESSARSDHYDLFLLVQDMFHTAEDNILELPVDACNDSGTKVLLGSGGSASVLKNIKKGRWKNRSVMAYKHPKLSFDTDGRVDEQASLDDIVNELRALSSPKIRSHPNINCLRGIAFRQENYQHKRRLLPALILDPSPLGSLLDFISDPVRMVDGPHWEFCVDIGHGLQVLHGSQIIHGDLKCENVLIFPTVNDQRRGFVARLTDFGCSMNLQSAEPYTRLRGATPPYDAPEADEMIYREYLPYTDIYSYGMLIWRVALDGADPFNRATYRYPGQNGEGKYYFYTLIREDKRNYNILHLALTEMLDPELQLSDKTAESFCEVLRIALDANPTARDLGRIMETFARNAGNFEKRPFGLTASAATALREVMRQEIMFMREASLLLYGLPQWEKLPPKASPVYHLLHRYGAIDCDFKGFRRSTLPPASKGIREVLQARENIYLSCGKAVPTLNLTGMSVVGSLSSWGSYLKSLRFILRVAALPAKAVALLNRGNDSCAAAYIALHEALDDFAAIIDSMRFLDIPPARKQSSHQSIFDRAGGVAATDILPMMSEPTKSSPLVHEPSEFLDFGLLSAYKLPFAIQEHLFTDISSRARVHANRNSRTLFMMEEATCYLIGFGVTKSHERYFTILTECCRMGHTPAQEMLPRVCEALGFATPWDLLSPRPSSSGRCGRDNCLIVNAESSNNQESSIHHAITHGSATDVKSILDLDPSKINQRNPIGDTPLITAFLSGKLAVVRLLMERNVYCGAVNNLGESALHWVSAADVSSMPGLISQMKVQGANLEVIAGGTQFSVAHVPFPRVSGTALHRAVAQGNKDTVQELLQNGSSVYQPSGPAFVYQGHTWRCDPVQLACAWHEADILEMLLDSAPFYPINSDNPSCVSLLGFAIRCTNMHQRMARYGSNTDFNTRRTIDLLMGRGCVNIVDSDGLTAVQLAVISGSTDVLEHLLTMDDFRQDINTIVDGKTALHWAIARDDTAHFEVLIRNGANVLQTSDSGHIFKFVIMVSGGKDYFLKRIMEISPTITEMDKSQALATALAEHWYHLADFLLGHGADINGMIDSKLFGGTTVFGEMLSNGNAGTLVERLEKTLALAKTHRQYPQFVVHLGMRETALHLVAGPFFFHHQYEYARAFALLLEVFPNRSHLEARNLKGLTPLHLAIMVRNAVAVRALVDAGADVNSMTLFAEAPIGLSSKDLLFGQLFGRAEYYDLDPSQRKDGEIALEQIFKIFKEPEVASRARLSATLRSQQRMKMSRRMKRVANFFDVISFLPDRLPRIPNAVSRVMQATQAGSEEQVLQNLNLVPPAVAEAVQWTCLESQRFMKQTGVKILKNMGLLDDYLDEASHKEATIAGY